MLSELSPLEKGDREENGRVASLESVAIYHEHVPAWSSVLLVNAIFVTFHCVFRKHCRSES